MDTVTRHPRDYELMTIFLPDMSEEDNQAALAKVSGYISDVNAELKETLVDSPWGRRRLAYTIRHEGVDYRDGFYVVMHFTAAPTSISDIERELKLDTNVIRYLLVSDDPKAGEPTVAQPEGDETAPSGAADATTEAAPATEPAAEEAPAAVETTEEAPAAEGETEAAVETAAEVVEGEDEPAPADGAEADDKES